MDHVTVLIPIVASAVYLVNALVLSCTSAPPVRLGMQSSPCAAPCTNDSECKDATASHVHM